jgi:Domain of unknown function (DUF397)
MITQRPPLARTAWRASSYSAASGNCIEVAQLPTGHHAVRDSKNPTGPILTYTLAEWSAFTAGVRAGQFG